MCLPGVCQSGIVYAIVGAACELIWPGQHAMASDRLKERADALLAVFAQAIVPRDHYVLIQAESGDDGFPQTAVGRQSDHEGATGSLLYCGGIWSSDLLACLFV